jgi:hypothetical protein
MKVIIELPFKLPTWNRLLGVNRWERKSIRDSIHRFTSMFIAYEKDSQTLMVSLPRHSLMDSYIEAYYGMITPSSSKKSPFPKKKGKKKKQLSQSRTRKQVRRMG